MKFLQILPVFLLISSISIAQEHPEVGEKLVISNSSTYGYKYLHLPNANFIIKKNGRLNYDQLVGKSVIIQEIKSTETKNTVVLRRADGKKFFGSFPVIKANYEKAVQSGELKQS